MVAKAIAGLLPKIAPTRHQITNLNRTLAPFIDSGLNWRAPLLGRWAGQAAVSLTHRATAVTLPVLSVLASQIKCGLMPTRAPPANQARAGGQHTQAAGARAGHRRSRLIPAEDAGHYDEGL